jgi:hypothetical protein
MRSVGLFLVLSVFAVAGYAAEVVNDGAGDDGHDISAYTHLHHGHNAGMWMFEYRFMRMKMDGLLDGTTELDQGEVSGTNITMTARAPGKSYEMEPTDMTMDMHMLMVMYDVSARFTLMGMANYLKNDMGMFMQMQMGSEWMEMDMPRMESSGVGDTIVSALYQATDALSLGLGVSLPTGSIDEEGVMMEGEPKERLPYMMQLSSGTYDLIPSVTYNDARGAWNWGAQGAFTYRSGENANEYRLGHRLELGAWAKVAVASNAVVTGRLAYTMWGAVEGADPELDPHMSPDADPDAQGGTRADVYLGASAFTDNGWLFSLEYGVPVNQNLNGPQMKTTSLLNLGVTYMMM